MTKRKRPSGDRTAPITPGNVARSARETLRSYHGRGLAHPQRPDAADAVGGVPAGRVAAGGSPHEALAGQGPLGPAAKPAALARADLRRRRVGRTPRPRSVGPGDRGNRPAERRLRGAGLGPAVSGRRALAGPGRGCARGQGVRRPLGRVAQRLDHRLLLRRVHQRRDGAAILGAAHPGHHLRPQQGPSSRPEATLVHPHGHRRRRRALALPRRKRQRGGRPDAPRHLGPALPVDRPTRLPLRGRLQAGHQRKHGLPAPASGAVRHRAAADARRRRRLPHAGGQGPGRLAAVVGKDRRRRQGDRPLLHQRPTRHHRRRLPAGVVSQPAQGRAGRRGPQRADREGLEATGGLAGKAPLAADPLPPGSQGGRGRGGDPRVVRGRVRGS